MFFVALSVAQRKKKGAAISPESAEIMAKLGIGVLSILQREWDGTVAEIERDNAFVKGAFRIPPFCKRGDFTLSAEVCECCVVRFKQQRRLNSKRQQGH